MRVLVFGDSIAQGFWDEQGGWVSRLIKHYHEISRRSRLEGDYVEMFNLGISGDKADKVLARMEAEITARKWHDEPFALIFAVGVNDSYIKNGEPYCSTEEYAQNIVSIINKARNYSQKILFVGPTSVDETLTNPVDWDNIVWTNQRIKQFDAVLHEVCAAQNVPVVDVFDKYVAGQAGQNLFEDGEHQNEAGHQLLAELVRPALDKLLDAPTLKDD
jgi:lysophospholipase L1-like esterase